MNKVNNISYTQEEVYNIKIEEVEIFFSSWNMKFLKNRGINTLGQLFKFVDNENNFRNIPKIKEDEIVNTTNILRCKYLNEDPEFDLDSKDTHNYEKKTFDQTHQLINMGLSGSNLLRQIVNHRKDTLKETLEYFVITNNISNLTGVGPKRKKEFVAKATIILDYYKEKDDDHKRDIEELTNLNNKLNELIEKKKLLDKEINSIMNSISSKTNEVIQKTYKRED